MATYEYCPDRIVNVRRTKKINLKVNNRTGLKGWPSSDVAVVELCVKGKKICIDVADGYNNLEFMRNVLPQYDYYFKRSNDIQKNNELFGTQTKIFPYGLNFEVYHPHMPEPFAKTPRNLKNIAKRLMGLKNARDFYLSDFERIADDNRIGPLKICFMTRLWNQESGDDETEYINRTRISIIRALKKHYGKNFMGGI